MGNVSNDRVHRIRRFWENQVIVGNLHFMLGNKHPPNKYTSIACDAQTPHRETQTWSDSI